MEGRSGPLDADIPISHNEMAMRVLGEALIDVSPEEVAAAVRARF